jgi:hypothetical protein
MTRINLNTGRASVYYHPIGLDPIDPRPSREHLAKLAFELYGLDCSAWDVTSGAMVTLKDGHIRLCRAIACSAADRSDEYWKHVVIDAQEQGLSVAMEPPSVPWVSTVSTDEPSPSHDTARDFCAAAAVAMLP